MPDINTSIRENARIADAIVIGRVITVGPPPPAWSGMFAAWQRVDYQPLIWLKKPEQVDLPQSITAYHLVVSGAPTADPTAPRLRNSIFYRGAELVLFVRVVDSRYEVFDEHLGALPNDPKTVQQIEATLREPAVRPSMNR
jgi:hypothetical protein